MANHSKEEKVRHSFTVEHYTTLNNERLNPSRIIELCWERIPSALIQKLNSTELLDYINLHILPKVVAEQKLVLTSVFPKGYFESKNKKHNLEVFA